MILGYREDALKRGALSCHLIRSWHQSDSNHSAAAESLQSCPTLCDPIDRSLQAPPSLEFSRQEYWSGLPFPSPTHACMLSRFSCVQLCLTPWTAAHQAPLSTVFSRQEYWSGLPFPSQDSHPSEGKVLSHIVVLFCIFLMTVNVQHFLM